MYYLSSIAVLLLLGSSHAMVGSEEFEARRRALEGTTIAGSYMASAVVASDAECAELKKFIKGFQVKKKSYKTALSGQEVQSESTSMIETMEISKECFVHFEGSESMVNNIRKARPELEVSGTQLHHVERVPKPWGLNRIDQHDLPLGVTDLNTSHTGKNVTVYIIDTGIWESHDDFGDRVRPGVSFVEGENYVMDRNGHGTHCAGIAVGTQHGVAKDAQVVGIKVLSAEGSGSTVDIIKGVAWAVNDALSRNTTGVLSLSLGGTVDPILDAGVDAAVDAGMLVVVAAGNNNGDACKKSPARAAQVITVGASNIADHRSVFSNWGTCVNVFAPGTNIISSWIGADDAVNMISGTSMATPLVAGVLATLLEKHDGDAEAAKMDMFELVARDKLIGVKASSPNWLVQTSR
mmetsp:Transcript_12010/g.19082  ORF Transcript_12010/g.19082 Transcript_12010/m.19082 type:complete len:408 (+) Transcript_12010:207-1430(+)